MVELTAAELAEHVGAEIRGSTEQVLRGAGTLAGAGPDRLAFCNSERYLRDLRQTQAGAVVLAAENAEACPTTALVVDNPYYAFAVLASLLHPPAAPEPGIAPSAVVAADAQLGDGVAIEPHVVIRSGARLGDGVVVEAGSVIGRGAVLGERTRVAPRVVIGDHCQVGARCLIHAGVVIGADGFGFAPAPGGGWQKVPQIGAVRIGNDVEIGANATLDRGALIDTVVEDGVKLDDQVHVAHNCRVGEATVIAGGTALAGSVTLGRGCMIGGQCAIADHTELADGVVVLGMSGVMGPIREAGTYGAAPPLQPLRQWRRNAARMGQLDSLFQRVRQLERGEEGDS